LYNRGSLEEVILGVFALNSAVEYDEQVGLLIDEIPNNPSDFMAMNENCAQTGGYDE
jgi:hypothetical protein